MTTSAAVGTQHRSATLERIQLEGGLRCFNQRLKGARKLCFAIVEPIDNDFVVVLADLLHRYPLYETLGVANLDGQVVCSAVPIDEPVTIADRTYFQDAVTTDEFPHP